MIYKHYLWVTVVSSALFVTTTVPALATGTFFVDTTIGNDANNCTSADTACLTFAGAKTLITALPDPSNTTLKLNGIFTDQILFTASDVTQPDTLDGLHITATDKSNQPTIDTSVAGTAAVQVTDIDVAVTQATKTGAPLAYGIAVGADGYALAVGRDNVNNDSFKSDYNLLYNATVADQLIYDTDNSELVYLGTDINGDQRPLNHKTKQVDIGADEYKQ